MNEQIAIKRPLGCAIIELHFAQVQVARQAGSLSERCHFHSRLVQVSRLGEGAICYKKPACEHHWRRHYCRLRLRTTGNGWRAVGNSGLVVNR